MVGVVGIGSWTTGCREVGTSGRTEGVIVVAELSTCIESSGEVSKLLVGTSDIPTGEGAAGTAAGDT